jgi:hypothetical protein
LDDQRLLESLEKRIKLMDLRDDSREDETEDNEGELNLLDL